MAFFSLEMSGPEGGKAFGQGAHREICRDPPDADGDPQYQVKAKIKCTWRYFSVYASSESAVPMVARA